MDNIIVIKTWSRLASSSNISKFDLGTSDNLEHINKYFTNQIMGLKIDKLDTSIPSNDSLDFIKMYISPGWNKVILNDTKSIVGFVLPNTSQRIKIQMNISIYSTSYTNRQWWFRRHDRDNSKNVYHQQTYTNYQTKDSRTIVSKRLKEKIHYYMFLLTYEVNWIETYVQNKKNTSYQRLSRVVFHSYAHATYNTELRKTDISLLRVPVYIQLMPDHINRSYFYLIRTRILLHIFACVDNNK